MSRVYFNQVSLQIPEDWSDNSTIALTGPTVDPENMPSPHTRLQPMTPNVVLRREACSDDPQLLERIADYQKRELEAVPGSSIIGCSTISLCIGGTDVDALCLECVLPSPDTTLAQQLQLYFVVAGFVYIFIATATLGTAFESHRERFLQIARSIQVPTTPV